MTSILNLIVEQGPYLPIARRRRDDLFRHWTAAEVFLVVLATCMPLYVLYQLMENTNANLSISEEEARRKQGWKEKIHRQAILASKQGVATGASNPYNSYNLYVYI